VLIHCDGNEGKTNRNVINWPREEKMIHWKKSACATGLLPLVIASWLTQQGSSETNNNDTVIQQPNCSLFVDCFSCLSAVDVNTSIYVGGGCVWGSNEVCGSKCDTIGADEGCYANWALGEFDESKNDTLLSYYQTTTESVCGSIEQDKANMELCRQITDCATCQLTSIQSTDGLSVHNCQWYEDRGYCSSMAGDGAGFSSEFCPGAFACESTGGGCSQCLSANNAFGGCIWSGDTRACHDYGCWNELYCFSLALYPNSSMEDICQASDVLHTDVALCQASTGTECATCTSQIKSDGNPCVWFPDSSVCEIDPKFCPGCPGFETSIMGMTECPETNVSSDDSITTLSATMSSFAVKCPEICATWLSLLFAVTLWLF